MRYYRGGADVKNYIRPYYRNVAALGLGATVLQLQRSGTTVGAPAVLPRRGLVLPQVPAVLPLHGAVLPQAQYQQPRHNA